MFFKCKTFHAETSTYNNKRQKREKHMVSHMVIIGLLRDDLLKQFIINHGKYYIYIYIYI